MRLGVERNKRDQCSRLSVGSSKIFFASNAPFSFDITRSYMFCNLYHNAAIRQMRSLQKRRGQQAGCMGLRAGTGLGFGGRFGGVFGFFAAKPVPWLCLERGWVHNSMSQIVAPLVIADSS